jgi:hypothetical protein
MGKEKIVIENVKMKDSGQIEDVHLSSLREKS